MLMTLDQIQKQNGRVRVLQPVQRTISPVNAEPPPQLRSKIVTPSRPVQRALTLDTHASPFSGACNFFDRCTDEIMSLHYGGALTLLDWMGWEVSNEYRRVVEFIAYVRPEYSGGNPTSGALSNACADPNGIEFGTAKLDVEDFGRYGRSGPTRDMMKPERYCMTDPVRRLDGSVVTSEREWDLRFIIDVLLQDVRRDLVTGNSSNAGEFGGLEEWVSTIYTGPNADMLQSLVINWNGNAMSGGAGITWNGTALASTLSLIDVLLPAFRNIRSRIMWARQLANQSLALGDMILVLPTFLVQCLLDHYTCWSVCEGSQYSPVNLEQREARSFRNRLVAADNPANLFGHGYITLDNVTIPLLAYDWGTIKGPTTGDIFFLTGAVGSARIWEGEHLSAAAAASAYETLGYFQSDGGRILGSTVVENECSKMKAWIHPRLFCRAPWAQIRIQNVKCDTPGGPLSPDPTEASFFPIDSFSAAEC